jgi:hypothetical protein
MFRGEPTAGRSWAASAKRSTQFSSQCLSEFLGRLRRVDPHPSVLYLGALCGDNIAFMGERGCRVSVESLPLRPQQRAHLKEFRAGVGAFDDFDDEAREPVDEDVPARLPSDVPVAPLNYPHESFAGVLAWDMISQMPFQEGIAFVETLRQLLLEGGVILAYFPGPPGSPGGSTGRYRILDEDHLLVEPTEDNESGTVYENREIYSLFSRFDVVRLSHQKSGTREVLVVKTSPSRRPKAGGRLRGL